MPFPRKPFPWLIFAVATLIAASLTFGHLVTKRDLAAAHLACSTKSSVPEMIQAFEPLGVRFRKDSSTAYRVGVERLLFFREVCTLGVGSNGKVRRLASSRAVP